MNIEKLFLETLNEASDKELFEVIEDTQNQILTLQELKNDPYNNIDVKRNFDKIIFHYQKKLGLLMEEKLERM